jgi:hypothetical protein
MAIPVAFTKARDKLQRARQQGDRATQGVQRKRYAPLAEVLYFRGKRHVRQQVTKSPQRVHKREERQHEPQDFRQEPHVGFILPRFLAMYSTAKDNSAKVTSRVYARYINGG